jgi:purine-binding chemotaxis protein CheW
VKAFDLATEIDSRDKARVGSKQDKAMEKTTVAEKIRAREGKYLTFKLGREEYGIEILKVREIIGYMAITAVPRAPEYIKGVINLRGQVIPVLDLRSRFGMDAAEVTEQTCIIVADVSQRGRRFNAGLVVDQVQEVLDIAGDHIEDAPQFGNDVQTDIILGIGKINDTIKILLDIDKVLDNVSIGEMSRDI